VVLGAVALLGPGCLEAQPSSLDRILQRLESLEEQNRALAEEVRALRRELSALPAAPVAEAAPLEERVTVQDRRIEEHAQTKVESAQKFPIRITGMALFNGFLNSHQSGSQYPVVATPGEAASGGAGFRQTVLGLQFHGPRTVGGGRVQGSVYMDFFGGTGQLLNQGMRLRTANVELQWGSRTLGFGLEKPLFAPREPNSLAQVGISPLTGAGNLWLWIPQVRFEQGVALGEASHFRAQIGVVQTRESASFQVGSFVPALEAARPGYEGRFELSHGSSGGPRLEIAPGFHYSVSHVAGVSVPSRLFSLDWLAGPWHSLELSGAFFSGQNVAHLGTGGTRQGFLARAPGDVNAIRGSGGWAQLSWLATGRLTFNFFSGQHDDRNSDLLPGRIGKNLAYGANFLYRLAPNVIVGLESSQVRTRYIGSGDQLNNHYDLALAYLF
jgi:hypothetical protein